MMRFVLYIHIDEIADVIRNRNNPHYPFLSNYSVIQRLKVWEFNKHTKYNNFRLLKGR